MSTSKPLRADAARNREAILRAAGHVLAREGLHFRIDEVARAAGVGNATLYRHFPDHAALVDAAMAEKTSAYAEALEQTARLSSRDPATAFEQLVGHLTTHQAHDRAFAQLIGSDAGPCASQLRRAFDASLAICEAARRAEVIRPDFEHADLLLLVRAIDGLLLADPVATPALAQRLSSLFLDAVRHPARHTDLG
ncbi:MAG: TetR/AcrR family transcriptional regulator [Patulibacter minatonensis]